MKMIDWMRNRGKEARERLGKQLGNQQGSRLGNRRGFTLAEVIIVVVIMGILAGVGFPAIIHMRNNLRQTELDDKARAVFVAAQNQLLGMKASGVSLDGEGVAFAGVPSDWPSDGKEEQKPNKVVASEMRTNFTWMDDTAYAPLTTDGNYIIEYNVRNYAVYGVFYWEKKGGLFQPECNYSYGSYTADINKYNDAELRTTKDSRKKVFVGYYGGQAISSETDKGNLDFQLILDNGPELKLSIITQNITVGDTPNYLVKISSKTSPESSDAQAFTLPTGSADVDKYSTIISWNGNNWDIILDSLVAGKHFADNFGNIAAGDDISITVTGYGTGSVSHVYEPKTKSVDTNSLFAGTRGIKGQNTTVTIENGRHLQNLDYAVSNVGYKSNNAQTKNVISEARQTKDIDWQENYADYKIGNTEVEETYDSITGGFSPIGNWDNISLKKYDGGNRKIFGLHVVDGQSYPDQNSNPVKAAGLFGLVDGMEIKGVNLVNPIIGIRTSDVKANYAGALVAVAKNSKITDCGAFIEKTADKTASDKYSECGVSALTYTGGLIGWAQNDVLISSFSAVSVSASEEKGTYISGGLVGKSEETSFTNCYSGGHTEKTRYAESGANVIGYTAGGLVGQIDSKSNIDHVYSTCSVRGTAVGSLFGGAAASATEFVMPSGSDYYSIGRCFGTDNGIGKGDPSTFKKTVATLAYDDEYLKENEVYPYKGVTEKHYGDWESVNIIRTGLVYYELYQDGSYGFWNAADISSGENGTLKEDAKDDTGIIVSDGYGYLSNEKITKLDVTLEKGKAVAVYEYDTANKKITQGAETTITGANGIQYLYPFPWEIVDSDKEASTKKSFYISCDTSINDGAIEGTFYFNPHFAQAITTSENDKKPANNIAIIRTARQLYELGRLDKNGTKNANVWYYKNKEDLNWSYIQTHNIDFSSYDGITYSGIDGVDFTRIIIGVKGNVDALDCNYDGQNHSISHYVFKSGDNIGNIDVALFGYIDEDTIIQNIVLDHPVIYNMKVGTSKKMDGDVSGFAVSNAGTIKNVTLISPKIMDQSEKTASGFVMGNSGTIEQCYIIPEQSDESSKYSHVYNDDSTDDKNGIIEKNNYTNTVIVSNKKAAGFVLKNSGTITNSAAIGSVTGGTVNYSEDTGVASVTLSGAEAAGFVNQNDKNGSISNSYANCYVAAEKAAGFATDAKNGTIDHCYALRKVSATTSAAGFASETNKTTKNITNSYNALSCQLVTSYSFQSGGTYNIEGVTFTDECYSFSDNGIISDTNKFLKWTENDIAEDGGLTYSQLKATPVAITGFSKAESDGSNTVRFSRNISNIYPFPMASDMVLYGDWPNYEYVGAEMVYYEVYKEKNGTYTVGFFNENLNVDSLRDGKNIFQDGYGLLFGKEYLSFDSVDVKNLIEGNGKQNANAYITWEDYNGTDSSSLTNYLKSVYVMKDNSGQSLNEVFYYATDDEKETAKKIARGDDFSNIDAAVKLKINEKEGDYYFRMLPPAAVETNGYVPEDSIYQELQVHVKSTFDEDVVKGGVSIDKTRTFYYCPHFAKSVISTDGIPKDPDHLIVRTVRQLCTLQSNNLKVQDTSEDAKDNTIKNYYNKNFIQEQDIDLGETGTYTYYYTGVTMSTSGYRNHTNYRFLNSSIGTDTANFTGSYKGAYTSENTVNSDPFIEIKGIGKWSQDKKPGGISVGNYNNYALFGSTNGAEISYLRIDDSYIQNANSTRAILCTKASKTRFQNISFANVAVLSTQEKVGCLLGEGSSCTIQNVTLVGAQISGTKAVGGLAGVLTNTAVQNCGVTSVEVTASGNDGTYRTSAGGIIGRLVNKAETDSDTNSFYSCTVTDATVQSTGKIDSAGGIGGAIGWVTGNVHDIEVTGVDIDCAQGQRVGGVFGHITGGMERIYLRSEAEDAAKGTTVNTIDAPNASHVGGIAGYCQTADSTIKTLVVSGTNEISAVRAVAGFIGQISVQGTDKTTVWNCDLTGSAEITQLLANNSANSNGSKAGIYNGASLFIGHGELKTGTLDIGDIVIEGDDGKTLHVSSNNTSQYQTGGLLFGSIYNVDRLSDAYIHSVTINNAEIMTNKTQETSSAKFEYDGAIAGNVYNANIKANAQDIWDFSNTSITLPERDLSQTRVAGMIGNYETNTTSATIILPQTITLPDIDASNNKNKDISISGVINNTSGTGKILNIASNGECTISLGKINAPYATYVGGFTNQIDNRTQFNGAQVTLTGGEIRGINPGGFAGKIASSQELSDLTVSGTNVYTTVNSGTAIIGGFAGAVSGGTTIKGCSVNDIELSDEASTETGSAEKATLKAGGFIGTITAGSVSTSSSSGRISCQAANLSSVGGFVGEAGGLDSKGGVSAGFSVAFSSNQSSVALECGEKVSTEIAGGYAGIVYGGTLTECAVMSVNNESGITNNLNLQAEKIGGFAGELQSVGTSKCYTEIVPQSTAVTAMKADNAGGFAGIMKGNAVDSCYVKGNLDYQATHIGGFAGQADTIIIQNCYVTGNQQNVKPLDPLYLYSATENAGGFAGSLLNSEINNCHVLGDLQYMAQNVGGFVGTVTNGTITRSFSAPVSAPVASQVTSLMAENAGGFIGLMKEGTIESCYASRKINFNAINVGGFVGQLGENSLSISSCYASGDVTNVSEVPDCATGGFVGLSSMKRNVRMSQCYSLGLVNASGNNCAGFQGYPNGRTSEEDANQKLWDEKVFWIIRNAMKGSTIQNRTGDENNMNFWEAWTAGKTTSKIDSDTRGPGKGKSSALSYYIIGYPLYGTLLSEKLKTNEMSDDVLKTVYAQVFDTTSSEKYAPLIPQASENSYYANVIQKQQLQADGTPGNLYGLMTMWCLSYSGTNAKFFYWINCEGVPELNKTYTAYRVNLEQVYDENGSLNLSSYSVGTAKVATSDGKTFDAPVPGYLLIQPNNDFALSTTIQDVQLSNCYYLRQTDYNDNVDVGNYPGIVPWTVLEFSKELSDEANHISNDMKLSKMYPSAKWFDQTGAVVENAGGGYPYPVLENVGASISGYQGLPDSSVNIGTWDNLSTPLRPSFSLIPPEAELSESLALPLAENVAEMPIETQIEMQTETQTEMQIETSESLSENPAA